MHVRRLVDGRSNKRKRDNSGFSVAGPTDTEDEDVEFDVIGSDAASVELPNAITLDQVQVVDMSAVPEKWTQSTVVGGALRRNPDGTSMAPHIVKRKKNVQKVGQSMICSLWSCYISLGKLSAVVKAIYAARPCSRI